MRFRAPPWPQAGRRPRPLHDLPTSALLWQSGPHSCCCAGVLCRGITGAMAATAFDGHGASTAIRFTPIRHWLGRVAASAQTSIDTLNRPAHGRPGAAHRGQHRAAARSAREGRAGVGHGGETAATVAAIRSRKHPNHTHGRARMDEGLVAACGLGGKGSRPRPGSSGTRATET
jgi:hypothetical protein